MKLLCKYVKPKYPEKRISDSFCLYSSSDFDNMPDKISKANISGGTKVKVIGNALPRLTDWAIEFTGEWKNSAKYGYTFFAESHQLLRPETNKGIIKFLSSSIFPGIGSRTAELIVNEFGENTLDVIEHNPEWLWRIKGMSDDKIKTLTECYQKNISYSKLCAYLSVFGISSSIITKINDRFGSKAVSLIKHDPYVIQDVHGVGFYTCEKIARTENASLTSYARIEGAIKEVLKNYCEGTGDMCCDYAVFEQRALTVLNQELEPAPVNQERFRDSVKSAVKKGIIVIRAKKYVFLNEYDKAEENIACKVSEFAKSHQPIDKDSAEKAFEEYSQGCNIVLSSGQRNAVLNSLQNKISVITGGAGTGKTTILIAIIEIYKMFYPDNEVTLLAPTGKAARRISESTGYPASTIHSKLMIYEDYERVSQIEEGLIVIDEASMIDALLMDKLMSAISLGSHVVFVGDVNQLPSVGAGSVLRELITSSAVKVSSLTEIFRQKEGGSILDNSLSINASDTNLKYDDSFELMKVDDEPSAVSVLKRIYTREVAKYGIDNVALLTPLRRTQSRFVCVSDNLNKEIQEAINPVVSGNVTMVLNGCEYRIGDRVMQWKNTEKTSNGDVGIITEFDSNDEGITVNINWENGESTTETRDSMEDIKLAYSFSIYKSQGSEYDCCIIPLVDEQISPAFRKNLLYTAVTRCKKRCIIVSSKDKKALEYCIHHDDTNSRVSFLSKRIQNYM